MNLSLISSEEGFFRVGGGLHLFFLLAQQVKYDVRVVVVLEVFSSLVVGKFYRWLQEEYVIILGFCEIRGDKFLGEILEIYYGEFFFSKTQSRDVRFRGVN